MTWTSSTHRFLLLLATLALFAFAACAEPPTDLIKQAEDALLGATSVSECAEAEYREAEAMLNQAKALVESGDYEEAAVKAQAALDLARRAKAAGEANWEACQKAKQAASTDGARKYGDVLDPKLLKTVYFPYNEAILSDEAKNVLQSNADLLREFADSQVIVEGHCDERGSTEYNIALGERRSQAVRKYLMQLGIDGGRIGILSWGEEKPADAGAGEDALARNRRAEFRVK